MYQMSEMAALMESMYIENEKLKERIKKGDTIGQFPSHFLNIHKAVMTDESENDQFFKEQAALFIQSQELIYKDPKNAKQHFNEGINACVSCHQVKCGGPIPKIKKLYIK
jgi:alpha-acetolactate decarboxylase